MWRAVCSLLFLGIAESLLENDLYDKNGVKIQHFAYWPNGTIPFYIHPDHFDHEQSTIILTALTMFAYKTCLKFLPALVAPTAGQHVLVIENPNGVRQCVMNTRGHARDEPHVMVLGYNCLQSPNIDMMLMKSLGFSFEHNRAIRDLYINVQKENIDLSAMDLFVMDDKLPPELRALPYDVNSVMHFGEREFSKNGHRTIIILDHKVKQCREGLSDLDLRKIDIVYGPECRKRDRLEKIDLCQGYPGVARKKRSVDEFVREKRDTEPTEVKSLRVNPNITPPPELVNTTEKATKDVIAMMEELGIQDGVEEITNLVYKLGSKALHNLRMKHCNITNDTKVKEETESGRRHDDKKPDIFGVVEIIADYVKDMVDHALSNLTEFCQIENDLKAYQRQRCSYYSGGPNRCPVLYKSTKSGNVMYSTKHRPYIVQSTKHNGKNERIILYHQGRRDDGAPENQDAVDSRRKRDVEKELESEDGVRKKRDVSERRFKGRRYNVRNQSHEPQWDESEVSMEKKKGIHRKENPESPKDRKEAGKGRIEKNEVFRSKSLPKTVELSKKNKEFYKERKWPEGVVRYIISQDNKYDLTDLRRRLDAVNRILKERTCASIEEITEDDAERFEDYLVLDGSADYVTGKVGGRQNFGSLELFEGGQHKQHAAMMVMAMLGFYFEVARHDRDAHVRVHMRHVRPDKLHHFEKIRSDATLPLPYDYESATHPAWQFWRQIGRTGISTVATFKEKDPDGSIMRALGQHDQLLSETDIIKINSVYGLKCFEKKRERDPEDLESDRIVEVDLKDGHKGKKKLHSVKSDKLETWDRYKNENYERHKNNEAERHRDRDEHGRNRERHTNKHVPKRDEGFDDRDIEHDRDRGRYGNRHGQNRNKRIVRGKHEQERDKRINRDRYDRQHPKKIVPDRNKQERDPIIDRNRHGNERYKNRFQKRPREEDREDRERLRLRNQEIERSNDRHKEHGKDMERHFRARERDRMTGIHETYRSRNEDSSKKYQNSDGNGENKDTVGISNEYHKDGESDIEEVVIYKQRSTGHLEPENNWDHGIQDDPRRGTQENIPDYDYRMENHPNYDDRIENSPDYDDRIENNPVDENRGIRIHQGEMRRGREQIFAPVQNH